MKKIIKASALALTAAALLSSCGGKTELPTETRIQETTTVVTTKAETVVNKEGEVLEIATKNENYTIYVAPTAKPTIAYSIAGGDYTYNIADVGNESADNTNAGTTAKKKPQVIEEKAKGISLVTKSSTVMAGNTATIMIQGNAGKSYSIDFYETESSKASYSGLEDKKADENGFVSWTFEIDKDCESGNHKLYVAEKSSGNYIQTYITVI